MPPISRLHFNERNAKYSHLCCHVRVAALVIACLQLITFVYDLGNFAVYSLQSAKYGLYSKDTRTITTSSGGDDDDASATKIRNDDNDTDNDYGSMRQKGVIVGLVWDSLMALTVLSTLYGIRRVQPLYLVPQLITYAATVAICLILAVILIAVAFRSHYFDQMWIYILIVTGAAVLYAYFFHLIIRTFKYLNDKRRFMNDTTNIYIVPMGSGIDALPHDPYDVPPAYPGLLTGVDVTDSNNEIKCDVVGYDKLPSYDEAQKLRNKEKPPTEENRI